MKRYYFYSLFFITSIIHADQPKTQIPKVRVSVPSKSTASVTSGARTIIDKAHLRTTGAYSLYQALNHMGGVQLRDMVGNQSRVVISMRGFGENAASNTLFLVNGIPLTQPDLSPVDLSVIPWEQIEYIEIISGSESVLYGDQAVGGVVNVVLRQAMQNKSNLWCGAGSYNSYQCHGTWSDKKERFHYGISVSDQQTNNYREHSQFDQQLVLGHVDYYYPDGKFYFNYQVAQQDMQYPGALTGEQVGQNRRQSTNSTDFYKNNNGFLQLQHNHAFTPDTRWQTDLAVRKKSGHGWLSAPFTQSGDNYFVKTKIQNKWQTIRWQSGVDAQQDDYRLQSLFGETKNRQEKYGAFGLINVPVYSALSASFGARGAWQHHHLTSFNTNDSLNRAFVTTAGLSYQWMPDGFIYLRRAGSFRFPKADENAFAPVGVTQLRTQRGVAYESGVSLTKTNYSAKFEIYQLNLTDEIAFDPTATPQQPFGSNRNLDPTLRRGFNLSGKVNLADRWHWDGQYHFVNATFQHGVNAGARVPLVAEQILRTGLAYRISTQWRVYAEAVYTGNQYAGGDDGNAAGKLGGYTLYNFNLGYHWKNLSVMFHANNIFNKYYYFYTVYQSANKYFYPAPERNFMLTVKWDFA